MGRYYGPDWLRPYAQAFWYPKDWLNGAWSKADQDAFDTLYQWAPFRGEFDKILNSKNRGYYFNRNGLDYSDIKDPRNAVGSVATVNASSVLRFSDNYKKLYK